MNESVKIVFEELQDLKTRIADNIKSEKRNASGQTIASMHVDVNDSNVVLFGRKAFGTLETGRRPGNVPKGFYGIIKQWAIDKGLSFKSDRERNTFAYFVSRKIAAEGTSLYRAGGDANIYSKEIPTTLLNIRERLGLLVRTEVVNSIKLNSNGYSLGSKR